MKLRADRAALAAAAGDAARAIAAKPPNPLMNGAIVEAGEGGEVTVTGYDYDTCIRASVQADVLQPGSVLVPGRLLADFLGAMPDGLVELFEEGPRLRIVGKGCRYGLGTMTVEDYPALPAPPLAVGRLDGEALVRVAPRALTAARAHEIWWHSVVHLEATPECLLIGATDGNSASRYALSWLDGGPGETVTGELPGRLLIDAVRGLAGEVSLCMDDAQIALQTPARTVTSRVAAQEYVNWRRVTEMLPEPTTVVRVDRDELASAMQRAVQVQPDRHGLARVDIRDGELAYAAASPSGSEVTGSIDAEHTGEPLEVGIAPALLVDAVKATSGPTVELRLTGPRKVFVVRDADDDSGDLQLVMPKALLVPR